MTSISENFALIGDKFAADLETALAPKCFEGRDQVRLFQAWSPSHSFFIDLAQLDDDDWAELKVCLENPGLHTIWQNAAFDIRVLQGCGINLGGRFDDTMLMSWLLNNGIPTIKNNLAAIAYREVGVKLDKTLQSQNWMTAELNDEDMAYAMGDVEITWKVYESMLPKIKDQALTIPYEVELKALLPTIQMESTGLYLDRKLIDEQVVDLNDTRATSLSAFVEELDAELQDAGDDGLPKHEDGRINLNRKTTGSVRLGTKVYAGFNPGSSKQLLEAFSKIGIDPVDPTGKPSVDKKYLASYGARSVVKQYLSWKRSDKHLQMCKTLIDAQQEDGRIYARFNQTGTFTGRYSCVAGSTLLKTTRGVFRFDEYEPQVGDRVLTHTGQLKPVLRKIYKGEDRMFCITTKLGGQLTCTADHRVLTPDGWMRVGELRPGDRVVCVENLGFEPGECAVGGDRLQGRGQADAGGNRNATVHAVPQHFLHLENALTARGVQSGEGVAVLAQQARLPEPYAGQEWFPAPQLQGFGVRPQGLLDRARWKRWSGVSAPSGNARGAGGSRVARRLASSPHRWGPAEQRSGQPRAGYSSWSWGTAPEESEIVAIAPLGTMGVWDIEVEGDHSYSAGGFLNHNSSGPNLQNVPRGDMRYCFAAPEGRELVDLDYGGMELRALCSPRIADEPAMAQAFRDGADVHRATAALMFKVPPEDITDEERRQAKAVNFGAAYGSGAQGLVNYFQSIGEIISLEEGEAFRSAWLAAYPRIAAWHNICRDRVRGDEPVVMVDGRRRFLVGDAAKHTTMANNIVQGSCASAMKLALYGIHRSLPAIDETARLVAVIHDEVLIECKQGCGKAILAMAQAQMLNAGAEIFGPEVPLEAEGGVGSSWGAAK